VKESVVITKNVIVEKTKERWRGKRCVGIFPRNLPKNWWIWNNHIDGWNFGDFKRETGSTGVAAEDQTVYTNDFKNKILKKEFDNKCRLCQQLEETIYRLTPVCPILAKN
jgi:hypothetical protein